MKFENKGSLFVRFPHPTLVGPQQSTLSTARQQPSKGRAVPSRTAMASEGRTAPTSEQKPLRLRARTMPSNNARSQ
jgi:hypothetical protein